MRRRWYVTRTMYVKLGSMYLFRVEALLLCLFSAAAAAAARATDVLVAVGEETSFHKGPVRKRSL